MKRDVGLKPELLPAGDGLDYGGGVMLSSLGVERGNRAYVVTRHGEWIKEGNLENCLRVMRKMIGDLGEPVLVECRVEVEGLIGMESPDWMPEIRVNR